MPSRSAMASVAQDRTSAQESLISLKDALQFFWDWHLASIPVEVSFLGKARHAGTVRVSLDGLVTLVDAEGSVTVSGDRREIKLDLRRCKLSRPRHVPGREDVFHSLDPDSILQVTFPGGEICLVFPYRRVSHLPGSRPRAASGTEWLRNKLAAPPVPHAPMPSAASRSSAAEPAFQPLARRNLFVDVRNGQANIVEIVGAANGAGRVRRLREQFLPQDKRMHAEQLKRKIVHGENGGAYDLNGLYRPQTACAIRELTALVEELERCDGPHAWDRRRYPR